MSCSGCSDSSKRALCARSRSACVRRAAAPCASSPPSRQAAASRRAVRELLGVLQQTAAGLELRILIRLQSRTLDLIDLIAQRLRAAKLLALVHAQVRHFVLQALHGGKLRAVLLQQRRIGSEAVQKCQMVVLIEQRCGVVLAVDVDKLKAEPPQNGRP